jgi:uncharacterized protein YjbI with pentapeptide repeats
MKHSNLKGLELEVQKLNHIITELVEENTAEKEDDIDLGKLQNLGKQAPFQNHYIGNKDVDLADKYAVLLASAAALEEKKEKRIGQYYFIARIMASSKTQTALDEIVRDSKMISIKDFDSIGNELGNNGKKALLFDIFLMIALQGDIHEKQLDYFCEINAYFNTKKAEMQSIYQLVHCILTAEEKQIYQYAKNFPVNVLSCYLSKPISGQVVTSVQEISKVKDSNIIIYGVAFQNTEVQIDDYKKKKIKFINCTFENVTSVTATITRVEFDGCWFKDCQKEKEKEVKSKIDNSNPISAVINNTTLFGENFVSGSAKLFEFKEAYIQNCNFENCEILNDSKESIILKIEKGSVENCNFHNCSIKAKINYGSIVYTEKVSITNCKFIDCRCQFYGNNTSRKGMFVPLYRCVCIIFCKGGNVKKCKFLECICDLPDDRNYGTDIKASSIINCISAIEKNNTFEKCKSTSNIGSAEWRI